VKLLLDEQISGKVAERLRQQGCDVTAVAAEVALRGLTDPDVFELAQAQRRAVVTYNRADFEAIVRECAANEREHYGLVIVHPVRFPSRDFTRLVRALVALAKGEPLGRSFVTWLQEATSPQ
jgi:predicted nuclease of predicted toxin-antitoxin system